MQSHFWNNNPLKASVTHRNATYRVGGEIYRGRDVLVGVTEQHGGALGAAGVCGGHLCWLVLTLCQGRLSSEGGPDSSLSLIPLSGHPHHSAGKIDKSLKGKQSGDLSRAGMGTYGRD